MESQTEVRVRFLLILLKGGGGEDRKFHIS